MTTLFLDRDGVINERIPGAYVRYWSEFTFRPEVPKAIARLRQKFDYLFVITNQQGIGKGLMDQEMLNEVHRQMLREIRKAGGRIDAIYHCPSLENKGSFCRKPLPGMIYHAQRDFPLVDFRRAVVVGDMHSDIRLGHHLGMQTVRVRHESFASTKLPQIQSDYTIQVLEELTRIDFNF